MLRVSIALVLALLLVPGACAAPTVSAKIGPGPDGQGGDPYYLWANATQPEAPRNGGAEDDCGGKDGRPPPGPDGAILGVVAPIAAWKPLEEARLSGWFPRCIATQASVPGSAAGAARASYDVTTGRYYLAAASPVGVALPITTGTQQSMNADLEFTGTTGVSMVTDCEACPPPDLT